MVALSESILDSTKKALGLDANYDVFDPEIIMHINSVFFTLDQIGVGPENGYAIDGRESTWDAFLGPDPRFNAVKSYMYLRLRMLFDPPSNSFSQDAIKKQIEEHEWRLNVLAENGDYVRPVPSPVPVPVGRPIILEGGFDG